MVHDDRTKINFIRETVLDNMNGKLIFLLVVSSHTESQTLRSTRRNNEGKHGNHREEAVRDDQVNNVIQVFALQVKCKGGT